MTRSAFDVAFRVSDGEKAAAGFGEWTCHDYDQIMVVPYLPSFNGVMIKQSVVKRGQQRIHLMQKRISFRVCDTILCHFYHSYHSFKVF